MALLLKRPINPAWSYTVGRAQSPSPFYVAEPQYSRSSCSVLDDNWTPREPTTPLHVRWCEARRHSLTITRVSTLYSFGLGLWRLRRLLLAAPLSLVLDGSPVGGAMRRASSRVSNLAADLRPVRPRNGHRRVSGRRGRARQSGHLVPRQTRAAGSGVAALPRPWITVKIS